MRNDSVSLFTLTQLGVDGSNLNCDILSPFGFSFQYPYKWFMQKKQIKCLPIKNELMFLQEIIIIILVASQHHNLI